MPLTEPQRRHLERRLREERARATDALDRVLADWSPADGRGRAGDLTSFPFHLADRGTGTMDDELDASNATRLSRELAEIDAALARLYEAPERFGRCAGTDREIPFERLELIPWARTCAQSER